MKFTILVKREEDAAAPLTVSEIERTGPLRAASSGLTLAESMQLVAKVQQELAQSQFACHAEVESIKNPVDAIHSFQEKPPVTF